MVAYTPITDLPWRRVLIIKNKIVSTYLNRPYNSETPIPAIYSTQPIAKYVRKTV
jgi:hypothetical protein